MNVRFLDIEGERLEKFNMHTLAFYIMMQTLNKDDHVVEKVLEASD